MNFGLTQILALVILLMFGLMTGFFYAFSVSVMPGLDSVNAEAAIGAMQGINRAVRNPVFFVTFFLTPVFACALAVMLYRLSLHQASMFVVLAVVIYSLGVVLPTAVINVPMNEALALIGVSDYSKEAWGEYSARWAFWNTLRTGFSSTGLVFTGMALIRIVEA